MNISWLLQGVEYMTIRMFKAEIYRLKFSKPFYVMFSIGLVAILFQTYSILDRFYIYVGLEDGELTQIFGYNAFLSMGIDGFMMFFIPFIVVSIFSSEYSKNTYKNLITKAQEKGYVFLGKYTAFIGVIFMMNFIFAILSTSLCSVVNGWGDTFNILHILNILFLVIKYTLYFVSVASLIIILSFIIRSEALIVILFFVTNIIESLIASFLPMLNNRFFILISKLFPTSYSNAFFNSNNAETLHAWFSICLTLLISVMISISVFQKKEI